MNENLKINYEAVSKKMAIDTITTLMKGNDLSVAIDFAKKTIDDWKKEGKEDIVIDFKKLLTEKGLVLED